MPPRLNENIKDGMSIIKPIPPKIRAKLSEDHFMKECCLQSEECSGVIQWHHHLKFAGKRVNEPWCILPVCKYHHDKEAMYKSLLDAVMCQRATYDELAPYCKAINYQAIKAELDYE